MSTSSESHEDEDEKGKNYNFLAEEDSTRIYTFAASLLDPRTMTWHQEAYIRATTGALSINLVHLLKFDKEPTLVHSHQKYGCFFTLLDNHQEVSDCLYMTSNHRLDQSIQPESDHLFMLDGGTWDHEIKDRKTLTNNNLMFLVLRADRPDLRVPRRFRLVTADVFLFRVQQKPKDYLYWKSHHMIKHDSVASRVQHEDGPGLEDSVACAVRSILDQVEYLANGDHSREQNRTSRPKRTPDVVRQHQGKYFRLEGVWQQIFPGIVSVGGLSRALLGLVRAMHLEKPPLLREVLVEAILQGNENVRADTDGDYIVLTIDADDWRSGIKHYYLLPVLTADEPEAYESQYRYIKNGRHALPRPRRFKPADTAFMELYFEIDWEWRWKGSHYVENWRPIAEWNLPGYRRRRFLSLIKRTLKEESQAEVRVRARKDQIYDYIVRDLCHMMPPLRAIMRAYEPRLSIDDTWRLVENGETKAQRRMGLPKTIGGVKMDGSTYRVEIL
ncbi:hypothetical protein E8E12_003783 [Didymella heteroderae]|uniref:Uncharacterized protein n=1 Tax=Didymella heteroderae TaxID=1769908 RepID=A0A9P4WSU1_9PLEO|nr:hypothetical protein E8E12_003783 [Didymella heteroderae]